MKKNWVLYVMLFLSSVAAFAENSPDAKIGRLEDQLKTATGKNRITLLNELSKACLTTSFNKSIAYAQEAYRLSKESKDDLAVAISALNLGISSARLSDQERAFQHLTEALTYFQKNGDLLRQSITLKEIGNTYLDKQDFNQALAYLFKALEAAEKLNNLEEISACLADLGNAYFYLQNFEKALEYYQKALQISIQRDDKKGMISDLGNVALAYECLNRVDLAREYYLKALQLAENIQDKPGLLSVYQNMGVFYAKHNEWSKAREYCAKGITLTEELGDKRQLCMNLLNMGELFNLEKNYDQAILYTQRANKIAVECHNIEVERNSYYNLASIYQNKGQYNKAYDYLNTHLEMYKKIFPETLPKTISEMQVKYETLKKEKEIELLKKNNELLEKDKRIKAITTYALILGILLIIAVSMFLLRKYFVLLTFWKREKYMGHYRLDEVIGSGGMGTIYKGHHILDKTKPVAIKILRDEQVKTAENVDRFKHEAQIIDCLNHPNIVTVIERGEYNGKLFIAMEYVAGKTLEKMIGEEGPLPLPFCSRVMYQVADALALIHQKQIIHRDLKPSNIMVVQHNGGEPQVKLLDFGLAKASFQSSLTKTGIVIGTIHYLAPEQLAQSINSYASDVYSLGITYYELLTSRKAFYGDTATDIMRQVINTAPIEAVSFRPDIPAAINALIMQMVAKTASDRPSAEHVRDALTGICGQ